MRLRCIKTSTVLCGGEGVGEVDSATRAETGWIRAERPLEENNMHESLSLLNLSADRRFTFFEFLSFFETFLSDFGLKVCKKC